MQKKCVNQTTNYELVVMLWGFRAWVLMFNRLLVFWPKDNQHRSVEKSFQNGKYLKQALEKVGSLQLRILWEEKIFALLAVSGHGSGVLSRASALMI